MSHERYTLEERTKIIGRNPDWEKLSDRIYRKQEYRQLPLALPKEDVIFPLETAQPSPRIPLENLLKGGKS